VRGPGRGGRDRPDEGDAYGAPERGVDRGPAPDHGVRGGREAGGGEGARDAGGRHGRDVLIPIHSARGGPRRGVRRPFSRPRTGEGPSSFDRFRVAGVYSLGSAPRPGRGPRRLGGRAGRPRPTLRGIPTQERISEWRNIQWTGSG